MHQKTIVLHPSKTVRNVIKPNLYLGQYGTQQSSSCTGSHNNFGRSYSHHILCPDTFDKQTQTRRRVRKREVEKDYLFFGRGRGRKKVRDMLRRTRMRGHRRMQMRQDVSQGVCGANSHLPILQRQFRGNDDQRTAKGQMPGLWQIRQRKHLRMWRCAPEEG